MTQEFTGKVALVTGGGSGLGRASALAFAARRAQVVVVDIGVQGGKETVQTIRENGGQAIFVKADVSQAAEVEAMVDRAVEAYGRLDYAFNNAGLVGADAPNAHSPEQIWDRVIGINLKGVWLCMQYEIP